MKSKTQKPDDRIEYYQQQWSYPAGIPLSSTKLCINITWATILLEQLLEKQEEAQDVTRTASTSNILILRKCMVKAVL